MEVWKLIEFLQTMPPDAICTVIDDGQEEDVQDPWLMADINYSKGRGGPTNRVFLV